MAKITAEIVKGVKADIMAGMPHRPIAKKWSVGVATVSDIRNGKYDDRFNPGDPMVRSDALSIMQKEKKGIGIEALAKKLCTTPENAEEVLEHLAHHDNYNLVSKAGLWVLLKELAPRPAVNLERLKGDEWSFGIVGDPHLCCTSKRLDVCEAAFDEFSRQKIADVFLPGNAIHGEWRKIYHEIEVFGCRNQCQYFADTWPQRKGITTHLLTGDCHEGWYQDKGLIIGEYLQQVCEDAGRNDIEFIGHIEQDVVLKQPFGKTRIRIMHPGGGCSYALSYPSQKMVESFQGGEKPHVLILGHYHKFDVCYPREVVTIMPGTACDQTRFMRLRKLAAHVGFCVAKIGKRIDGTIGRCNVDWFPFYDKKYHEKLDEYEL